MAKSLYSAPEEFSISPLLFLLPSQSKLSKLKTLNSSLYARYERVAGQLRQTDSLEGDYKGLQAEESMLKQVLEWLDKLPST